MKRFVSIAITVVAFSAFGWSLFGLSAQDVEKAFVELGSLRKNEVFVLPSVKATKTDRNGIWKVEYTVVETKSIPQYENCSNNVDSAVHFVLKKSSIFDSPEDNRTCIVYKKVEERHAYVNFVSASQDDGKVVLKVLKAR